MQEVRARILADYGDGRTSKEASALPQVQERERETRRRLGLCDHAQKELKFGLFVG